MTSAKKSMTSVKFQERKPIFSRSFWVSRTIPISLAPPGSGRPLEEFNRYGTLRSAERHSGGILGEG